MKSYIIGLLLVGLYITTMSSAVAYSVEANNDFPAYEVSDDNGSDYLVYRTLFTAPTVFEFPKVYLGDFHTSTGKGREIAFERGFFPLPRDGIRCIGNNRRY